jgi:hypothetical protein
MPSKDLEQYNKKLETLIFEVRDHKVMLDSDLAELYGVQTKRLNEQIKRNQGRFPEDFMFQLSSDEFEAVRSKFATSKPSLANRRYSPYVFTEHGAVMLASILNSEIAMKVSVEIVRAFVRFRVLIDANKEIMDKLNYIEFKLAEHDQSLKDVFEVLRELIKPPELPKPKIGFRVE